MQSEGRGSHIEKFGFVKTTVIDPVQHHIDYQGISQDPVTILMIDMSPNKWLIFGVFQILTISRMKQWKNTLLDFGPAASNKFRSLDADLAGVMKAAQPFEWERIPFVLEAMNVLVNILML